MTIQFQEIRITGIDEQASGEGDRNSQLVNIVLTLSARAPHEWANYFNVHWEQHFYMMKRKAWVSGSRLTINCLPEELEKDHLPELRKVVAESNTAYQEHLNKQQQSADREVQRAEAQRAEIEKLKKNIKFD